jgi:hypothetical protein
MITNNGTTDIRIKVIILGQFMTGGIKPPGEN